MQANNSTNTTEEAEVDFPNDLYSQASKASVSLPQTFGINI